MSLHTFVDASGDSNGAVVYARGTYKDSSVFSYVEAAKTRVAPGISTSIPRLEIMNADVEVRLTNFERPRNPFSVYILVGRRKRYLVDSREKLRVQPFRSEKNWRNTKQHKPRPVEARTYKSEAGRLPQQKTEDSRPS